MSTLSPDLLRKMHAWWRAANYPSVGQIYLRANPLLEQPLALDHIKARLLGHWGTTPGLNLLYVHLNRLIKQHDLNMINIIGPGHGGPGLVANTYLEGTYTETYPNISRDRDGMRKLFRQFSWPGGIPSHVAPETPGSIHEGGELGYSLAHAYGAAFDNPDLVVACVIGDGEAEAASRTDATTTTTSMYVLNNMDRYQLALDAISRIPRLAHLVEQATCRCDVSIARHKAYISEHGEDLPEVRDWRWPA